MHTDCTICTYAAEHSSWPPDHRGTHCRDCHRSWEGLLEIHCLMCHEHFSSNDTLEEHKIGTRCVPPATAKKKDGTLRFRFRETTHGKTWMKAESRAFIPPQAARSVSETPAERADALLVLA